MKIIFILVTLLLFSIPIFSNDMPDPLYFIGIDPDTMTASQNHSILAMGKANQLDSSRKKSAISRSSFYDQTEYDVEYYSIEIAIDIEREYVDSATVKISAKSMIDGLSFIELDFLDSLVFTNEIYMDTIWDTNLVVDSIYIETDPLNYEHVSNKLLVELDRPYNTGENFSFLVRYHGELFENYRYDYDGDYRMNGVGLAFGIQQSWVNGMEGTKVAYTNSEPYESRNWWPCKDRPDDKADSVDISVIVPEPYYCASNGNLDEIEIFVGTSTLRKFNYRVNYPIATYIVALAISEYTVWSDWYHYGDNDSMEIVNHVYPDLYEDTFDPLSVTPNAMEILSDLYCQYPFINEKYGHAHWECHSAMEHQTCTSTSYTTWGTSLPVVIHELAHQWFGDMITCRSWHDLWLNEGFASYSEALYYEAMYGVESFRNYMTDMEYFDDRSVYVYDTTDANEVFDIVVYDKGAWVCHMLRYVVGDDAFFNFLHEYANSQYKYGSLTTEEFIDFIENSTGDDLTEFFNDWVYSIMYPVYAKQTYVEPDLGDGMYWTYLNLRQTQTYGPEVFEMPVGLRFYSGTTVILDTTVQNTSQFQRFVFKTSVEPDSIVIDPDNWILNSTFNMPWSYNLLPLPFDTADQYADYQDTIICRGGSGNNDYQIISGALPNGLVLNSETGELSGAPDEFGEFVFVVGVDDTYSSYSDELEYNIYVNEGLGWPGDANKDETVDILDIVFLINYKYKGGTTPTVPFLADPNNDCIIDILDIVFLINYKYKGGPEPELGCVVIK